MARHVSTEHTAADDDLRPESAGPPTAPTFGLRVHLVEAIGTFFLVLTIGCTVIMGAQLAPLAIGGVLMTMIFAGGHISGAHYNPAVSLAVALRGKLPFPQMAVYWGFQFAGALVGALTATMLTGRRPTATDPTWVPALVAEFIFTFALCWVVLNVATSSSHPDNSFYGLAIGFTVLAGAIAVGGISGGAFNPAVILGAAVMGLATWTMVGAYIVVQLVAAVIAAQLFRVIQPHDH